MGQEFRADRPGWAVDIGIAGMMLILSEDELQQADLAAEGLTSSGLMVQVLEPGVAPRAELFKNMRAAVVEVVPGLPASMGRLQKMRAEHPELLIAAAVRGASAADMRSIMRMGATDVISLPLQMRELASVIEEFRQMLIKGSAADRPAGRLISVIKSVGGVGATMLATQLSSLQAREERKSVCLFDLDLQFGNAGTYLGVQSPLTLSDLLDAGNRVDSELMKTVTFETGSGLRVVNAPNDILPMEAVNADQLFRVVDLAQQEFDAVYLDLPANWTNWSLSLVARSDVVFIVVELTIASLRQARRQIGLLMGQGVEPSRIRVIANRVEKGLFRSIGVKDAEAALNHPVAFTIANDFALVNAALDQGMLVSDLKPRSRVCKDIATIWQSLAMEAEDKG